MADFAGAIIYVSPMLVGRLIVGPSSRDIVDPRSWRQAKAPVKHGDAGATAIR